MPTVCTYESQYYRVYSLTGLGSARLKWWCSPRAVEQGLQARARGGVHWVVQTPLPGCVVHRIENLIVLVL